MEITEKTIQYVADLAKLTVPDEKKGQAAKDLKNILGYMETMNQLDTEGVEPMSHVLPIKNVFREDEVGTSGSSCLKMHPGRRMDPLLFRRRLNRRRTNERH